MDKTVKTQTNLPVKICQNNLTNSHGFTSLLYQASTVYLSVCGVMCISYYIVLRYYPSYASVCAHHVLLLHAQQHVWPPSRDRHWLGGWHQRWCIRGVWCTWTSVAHSRGHFLTGMCLSTAAAQTHWSINVLKTAFTESINLLPSVLACWTKTQKIVVLETF